MSHIELPRPVEAYFAFAELAPGRQGRRFTITFSYLDGGRVDRLQWWWQAQNGQLQSGGEVAVDALRREAVARFSAHIETWLTNSRRRISGGDPFPVLTAQTAEAAAPVTGADVVKLAPSRSSGQAA